jgi:phosphatidate cytidylyltransferase
MLRERVLTAIVLLALLVPAVLAASPLPFELLTLLMIGAAGWEWARLCGLAPAASVLSGVVLGLVLAVLGPLWEVEIPYEAWGSITVLWIIGGVVALRAGPAGFQNLNRLLRFVVGWVLIGAAWVALVAARQRGLAFLASVCALVWAADIFAYFVGRAIGKRKLAPAISPGKSWEGAIGGLAAVLVLATSVAALSSARNNLFSLLYERFGWLGMLLACAALVALAIVGDLAESLVKRAAGAKDSSRLLPGHGGVLDRIDALLPVFPASLALVMTL